MSEDAREFNLEHCLKSTGDSENLVRKLVAEDVHSEKTHKRIKANTDHMKIILAKQEVIDSGSAKIADFQEAVSLGETFIQVEIPTEE